jgi:hypothetical protein
MKMTAHEECSQKDKLDAHDRELMHLNQAVFFGNGSPSITSQLATMRQTVTALCWLVAVTCTAVIGNVVVMLLKQHGG